MRVLVFGASGMIGNAMIRVLSEKENWEIFGTVRSGRAKRFFSPKIAGRLVTGIDVENHDTLVKVFGQIRPDVVINCAGLTKHLAGADDPLLAIPTNALLPHRLAGLCGLSGARLVQVEYRCVFPVRKGDIRRTILQMQQTSMASQNSWARSITRTRLPLLCTTTGDEL